MNSQRIKAIVVKDWKEIKKSKQALLPMIILPLLLVVIMPAISIIAPTSDLVGFADAETEQFVKIFPDSLLPQGFDLTQKFVYIMVLYFFAPFFLLIPAMVSSIIAASSFAGEKERKTIEGLLYTPISDRELVLAKILVSLLPALIVSWICFLAYTVIVNALAFNIFHYFFFPNLTWIVLVFWLTPALSFASLTLVIAVSQRAAGIWEAQQFSMLIILPIIALLISQAAGLVYLNPILVFVAGAITLAIDIFAYRWIAKNLNRERIVTKFV